MIEEFQSLRKNSNLEKCTQKGLHMLQVWEIITQNRIVKNFLDFSSNKGISESSHHQLIRK